MELENIEMPARTHWVGLDVSKATFDAAWLSCADPAPSKNLARLPARAFDRTSAGVERFLRWLDAQLEGEKLEEVPVRCVMEATGRYSTELAVWLVEQRPGLSPAIAPPRQTSSFIKSLGVRNITDKIAAQGLAVYGRERAPEAYTPLSDGEFALREVCRYRDSLVRQRTMLKNQSGENTLNSFVVRNRAKRLGLLEKDIARSENEMCRMVGADPELERDIVLLSTIFGVGFLTAVVIRVELGDLRRFEKARSLSAFAGLNPSVRQSGTSVRGRTRLSKQGNSRARQALYLAAMTAIRKPSELSHTYQALKAKGKTHMAALGAVMRKILVLMRAILIHEKPYEPYWKLRGKPIENPS